MQAEQGVGCHDLGFKVRQRQNAIVVFFWINGLIHHERDEESQFGDLAGDGLNVHAIEAIFNEVEFAAVIIVVAGEGSFDGLAGFLSGGGTFDGFQGRFLPSPPAVVFGIELLQHMNKFLKHAHRKRAGAAGRVEGFQTVNGVNQLLSFRRSEVMAFLFP